MPPDAITASREFTVEFYHNDPMGVVWHGEYVQFFERARSALLDELGYGYQAMRDSGYAWPVVDLRVRYLRPLTFRQRARVEATLLEYENRLRIGFKIFNAETGELTTKGESVQMAVKIPEFESCFVSPHCLIERVERLIEKQKAAREE